jgi:hypothetical protein
LAVDQSALHVKRLEFLHNGRGEFFLSLPFSDTTNRACQSPATAGRMSLQVKPRAAATRYLSWHADVLSAESAGYSCRIIWITPCEGVAIQKKDSASRQTLSQRPRNPVEAHEKQEVVGSLSLSLSLMLRPTVSRPVCLGIKHPSGAYTRFLFPYGIRLTITFFIPWGALSDERTGLSFVCAAGPCQRNLSRVLVPWDLRPYSTVSDLILPFSSPPTTRRVTVEVFFPASTRVSCGKN